MTGTAGFGAVRLDLETRKFDPELHNPIRRHDPRRRRRGPRLFRPEERVERPGHRDGRRRLLESRQPGEPIIKRVAVAGQAPGDEICVPDIEAGLGDTARCQVEDLPEICWAKASSIQREDTAEHVIGDEHRISEAIDRLVHSQQ